MGILGDRLLQASKEFSSAINAPVETSIKLRKLEREENEELIKKENVSKRAKLVSAKYGKAYGELVESGASLADVSSMRRTDIAAEKERKEGIPILTSAVDEVNTHFGSQLSKLQEAANSGGDTTTIMENINVLGKTAKQLTNKLGQVNNDVQKLNLFGEQEVGPVPQPGSPVRTLQDVSGGVDEFNNIFRNVTKVLGQDKTNLESVFKRTGLKLGDYNNVNKIATTLAIARIKAMKSGVGLTDEIHNELVSLHQEGNIDELNNRASDEDADDYVQAFAAILVQDLAAKSVTK